MGGKAPDETDFHRFCAVREEARPWDAFDAKLCGKKVPACDRMLPAKAVRGIALRSAPVGLRGRTKEMR